MLNFDIAFTGDTAAYDPLVAVGVIQLGEHQEFFHAFVGFWSAEEYQASWATAMRRLAGGAEVSCLLTSVSDPAEANFLTSWPLYRNGDDVYVQNHLIFIDELDHAFDLDAPWESIDPHTRVDEDGNRISEWLITRTDIEDFIAETTS